MNIFNSVILLALGLFAVYNLVIGIKVRYEKLAMAMPENRFDQPTERLWGALGNVLGQRRLLRETGAGIMHVFIFWGVSLFAIGLVLFILEGLFPVIKFNNQIFYLLIDIFGIFGFLGMAIAGWRRWVAKVPRLDVGPWEEERMIVALTLAIWTMIISYFIGSAANAVATGTEARYALAPVTGLLTNAFAGMAAANVLYTVFYWLAILPALGLLVFFRYSPLVHPLAAPLNLYFRNLQPRGGQIKKINLGDEEDEDEDEDEDEEMNFGVSKITDYTWKQLLDCYACAECGRCQDNCPAYLSGKPLSPKKVILTLREHLPNKGDNKADLPEVAGEILSEDIIWACTNCYACQEHCPQLNEHINKLIDLRRHLVLDVSEFPGEAQLAFTNMERNSNPWGVGWTTRGDWADGLDVPLMEDNPDAEYLFYVGCAGSFDERIKNVAKSMVKILQAAGVSFAILGSEEKCCGDSARRLGNEYLFKSLIDENIETMNGYGVKKIITCCPHCFNSLKNEYPQFGGNYEVIHHTQLISKLLDEKKITLQGAGEKLNLTYHDSCMLGRYNEEYDAPRKIISKIPGASLTEMERNKNKAFCCGAGGGRMWLEEHGTRINVMRTEQALETNPELVAVNCPFCLTMIEDGLKDKNQEENVQVKDIAELVARYMQ